MFNPLSPSEVVAAIGGAAREAARGDQAGSDYARGQLLSAYSTSRHLSVELASFGPELSGFAREISASAAHIDDEPDLAAVVAGMESATDAGELGDATCLLLDYLRASDSEAAKDLRVRVQARLRALADREVELLADAIEAGKN